MNLYFHLFMLLCYYSCSNTTNSKKDHMEPYMHMEKNGFIDGLMKRDTAKLQINNMWIIELNYKDKIKKIVSVPSVDMEKNLTEILKEFFVQVYEEESSGIIKNFFSANNEILQIAIYKNKINILAKKYIVLPIKVIGHSGLMENRYILYEPTNYLAYQAGFQNDSTSLYNNMAKTLIDEIKQQLEQIKY
jgi:hypothetical protein